MRMRSSLIPAVTFLAISTGIAYGLSGLTVDKGSIAITPPRVSGHIVVWGCPGSVRSIAPVRVKVYNKSQKVMRGGMVAGDGSFAVAATGFQGDKLDIKFVAVTGGHKTIRMKVPGKPSALPPPSGMVVVEEVGSTGPPGDEEESEAVDVEPMIPVVEEGGDAPVPVEESDPIIPETLAPAPTLEERLIETGDLEELPVEMDVPPDEQPSPLSAEEEAAAVERVLARPPAVDLEPVIPGMEEGGDAPIPVEESEPIVPETLAPPPPLEERLVETGDLEELPVEMALPSDEQPSPLSSEEEAAAVERVLARPPAIDLEPVIPGMEEGGDAPVPVEESEPIVPDILAPPPPIEEHLVEPGGHEPLPTAVEEEVEVEVREEAGMVVLPATVAEKTPSAD